MKLIIQSLFLLLFSFQISAQGELINVSGVDEMARFASCEDLSSAKMKDMCAKKKLYAFINERLDYPEEAKKGNIQGTVLIQLKIGSSGTVENLKVLKQPDPRLGQAAMEAMQHMPRWVPGRKNGTAVPSLVNVPVMFRL